MLANDQEEPTNDGGPHIKLKRYTRFLELSHCKCSSGIMIFYSQKSKGWIMSKDVSITKSM